MKSKTFVQTLLVCYISYTIILLARCNVVAVADLATKATLDDTDGIKAASASTAENADDAPAIEEFLMACSQGDIDIVKQYIQNDSKRYVTAFSKNGESCLHVAGILGQSTVTQYILDHGGDPNQRSQYEHGLRMTPLSWNVYGNHIDNVRILLQAGANVNLDFDYSTGNSNNKKTKKVTVLDLLYITTDLNDHENDEEKSSSSSDTAHDADGSENDNDDNDDNNKKLSYRRKVRSMRDLLLLYGAKRYADLDVASDTLRDEF